MVGLGKVAQQTPFSVTGVPPSLVTFPPLTAELLVILPTGRVLKLAKFPGLEIV